MQTKKKVLGSSISSASLAVWNGLNLEESNALSLSAFTGEKGKKVILQSLLNIIYTTPQVRFASIIKCK